MEMILKTNKQKPMTLFSRLVNATDQDTESLIFLHFSHIVLYKLAYFHELQFSISNNHRGTRWLRR